MNADAAVTLRNTRYSGTMNRLSKALRLVGDYGIAGIPVVAALMLRRPVPVPGLGVHLPCDGSTLYHLRTSTDKLIRLARYVTSGDLVFDIGAHAGLFSVTAARRGARVVAIEPNPSVIPVLRANIESLNIALEDAAVTNGEPAVLWTVAGSTQTSSLLRDAADQFGEVEPVRVREVTLDELLGRYGRPDVVKLDIQGYESKLLASPMWDHVRVALVEVSALDPGASEVVEVLTQRVGAPHQVNEVSGGADMAFIRRSD